MRHCRIGFDGGAACEFFQGRGWDGFVASKAEKWGLTSEEASKPALVCRGDGASDSSGGEKQIVLMVAKFDRGVRPHRPYKIIDTSLYSDMRPTFVVDFSEQFEARTATSMAYRSQYRDQVQTFE